MFTWYCTEWHLSGHGTKRHLKKYFHYLKSHTEPGRKYSSISHMEYISRLKNDNINFNFTSKTALVRVCNCYILSLSIFISTFSKYPYYCLKDMLLHMNLSPTVKFEISSISIINMISILKSIAYVSQFIFTCPLDILKLGQIAISF